MNKTSFTPPWWAFCMSIGFIILGLYMLRVWKKSINPNASQGERAFNEWFNLIQAIGALIAGIVYLTILIIQVCTGWTAQ